MEQNGTRKWIYPKKPQGKFTTYRTYVSWLLLTILFTIPFIRINQNPFLLLNIIKKEFYLFGLSFDIQDFYLITIGLLTSIILIILFTIIFGRFFCGWLCPQTVFMEMVFRKIEYLIDGDRNKQILKDKQKWNMKKILKRALKWSIFLIVSIIISNVLLSYVIGIDRLYELISEGPIEHWHGFLVVMLFSGLFFFIFSWFREQACVLVCPYGRLQGLLIDRKTISVSYDYIRGEGINKRSTLKNKEKRELKEKGDCIDCKQCVVVCPTGIDIRNGSQLECINCAACVDACDEIMKKIGLPQGLIRYTSEDQIIKKEKFKFTKRVYLYSLILMLLIFILSYLLSIRTEVEAKIFRQNGTNYIESRKTFINQYQYRIINKCNQDKKLKFKMINNPLGLIELNTKQETLFLKKKEIKKGFLTIKIPKNEINQTTIKIEIGLYDEKETLMDRFKSRFEGPIQINF